MTPLMTFSIGQKAHATTASIVMTIPDATICMEFHTIPSDTESPRIITEITAHITATVFAMNIKSDFHVLA